MKISVIIPVFNTQEYIRQCLGSVLSQTNINDIEIIIVNDGSTDSSLEICKEYCDKYSNILLLDEENQGAANARNIGLQNATGEYIVFLDSDDFYENENTLFKLYNQIIKNENAIVTFNYKRYYQNSKSFSKPMLTCDYISDTSTLIEKNLFTSSPCMKMIKKEFLISNSITFEKGILSEDIEWNAKVLLAANKIIYIGDVFYIYRLRENSVTTSISKKHIENLIYIIKKLEKNADKNNTDYMAYTAFQYCTLLINFRLANVDKDVKKEIYEMKYLLNYNKIKTVNLIYKVHKILGINLTAKLLYLYFKIKSKQ